MKVTMKKTMLTAIATAALLGAALPASADHERRGDSFRDWRGLTQADRLVEEREAKEWAERERNRRIAERNMRQDMTRQEARSIDRARARGEGPPLNTAFDVYQGPTYNDTQF